MKDVLDETPPVITPRGVITLGLLAVAALGICYNALIGQPGRHPAPLGESWSDGSPAHLLPRPAKTRAGTPKTALPTSPASNPPDQRLARLQSQLGTLGYYSGPIDGWDGEGTRAAITAYQTDRGLDPTGLATPALREQLAADLAFLDASRFGAANFTSASPGKRFYGAAAPAKRNDRFEPPAATGAHSDRMDGVGDRVARVQKALAELGYQPGPADGIVGAQTREAIRQFQRDRELPVTGGIDEVLLKEMGKVTGISTLNDA